MEQNNLNTINKLILYTRNNYKLISVIFILILSIFIIYQIYNYVKIRNLNKVSIEFFNNIELSDSNKLINDLNKINKTNNIYSILSDLKLIKQYNETKEFDLSNETYKKLVDNIKLNPIYISSIASHAAITLIDASYKINSDKYFNDIEEYISIISDEYDSFESIKYELKYMFLVSQIDIYKYNYKESIEVIDLYNKINSIDQISSSVKERVKKIHEYQLYKK